MACIVMMFEDDGYGEFTLRITSAGVDFAEPERTVEVVDGLLTSLRESYSSEVPTLKDFIEGRSEH